MFSSLTGMFFIGVSQKYAGAAAASLQRELIITGINELNVKNIEGIDVLIKEVSRFKIE